MRGSRKKKICKQIDRMIESGLIQSDESKEIPYRSYKVVQGMCENPKKMGRKYRKAVLGDCKRRLYKLNKREYMRQQENN